MVLIKSDNLTDKDIFNMQASSVAMKTLVGKVIPVEGYAVVEGRNEDNEREVTNYIVSGGVTYGGNSQVVNKSMFSLKDYMSEHPEEKIEVTFDYIQTKGGRQALTMLMV